MTLGACGSSATDDASTVDGTEAPSELALDATDVDSTDVDSTDTDSTVVDSTDTDTDITEPEEKRTDFTADDFETLDDLSTVELTPEMFEELKTDETSRAAVLIEMEAQGLDAEEAACFLDNVSFGLFVTFGAGEQPNDAQFGELLTLLDSCEIAFGAES